MFSGLSVPQIDTYTKRLRAFCEVLALMVIVFLLMAFFLSNRAEAATTFNASVTSADGELTTTLTWESDKQNCIASGHPEWEGARSSSGTQQMPTLTLSGSYTLSLSCSSPGDRTATVRWIAPTQNTDGTPLTNLAGYDVYHSQDAATLGAATPVRISNPAMLQHRFENLAVGTWYFGAVAFNSQGARSVMSNVAQKTTTEESTDPPEVVTLTVNPVPNAPAVEVE